MLDCDATFISVPEFSSTRRSLPARLMAATALADGPAEAAVAPVSMPGSMLERQDEKTFTAAARAAFVDHLPAFDMPPLPVPPLADLRAEAARSFAPAPVAAAPEQADPAPVAADPAEAEARPVTPRRPLRFTSARAADEVTPVTLPTVNLFDGVFEDDSLDGPGVDPRLQRSRARARAQIAAMEATLAPFERNLWHDDGDAADASLPLVTDSAAQTADLRDTHADTHVLTDVATDAPRTGAAPVPRRPVRHLSPADIARTPRPQPQIHDPLRDRLRDLRDILYTPTPEEEAERAAAAAARPTPRHRKAAAALMALAMPLLALLTGLIVTVLAAARRRAEARPDTTTSTATASAPARLALLRQTAGRVTRALGRLLPTQAGLMPRLGAATAALATLAVPVDLLPFL